MYVALMMGIVLSFTSSLDVTYKVLLCQYFNTKEKTTAKLNFAIADSLVVLHDLQRYKHWYNETNFRLVTHQV
jgi:hypothetical protein